MLSNSSILSIPIHSSADSGARCCVFVIISLSCFPGAGHGCSTYCLYILVSVLL